MIKIPELKVFQATNSMKPQYSIDLLSFPGLHPKARSDDGFNYFSGCSVCVHPYTLKLESMPLLAKRIKAEASRFSSYGV